MVAERTRRGTGGCSMTDLYYRAIILRETGEMAKMEGMVPGPNVLASLMVVRNMNNNSWGGTLLGVYLHKFDAETGSIAPQPMHEWKNRTIVLGPDRLAEYARLRPSMNAVNTTSGPVWDMTEKEEEEKTERIAPSSSQNVSFLLTSFGEYADVAFPTFSTLRFNTTGEAP